MKFLQIGGERLPLGQQELNFRTGGTHAYNKHGTKRNTRKIVSKAIKEDCPPRTETKH